MELAYICGLHYGTINIVYIVFDFKNKTYALNLFGLLVAVVLLLNGILYYMSTISIILSS